MVIVFPLMAVTWPAACGPPASWNPQRGVVPVAGWDWLGEAAELGVMPWIWPMI